MALSQIPIQPTVLVAGDLAVGMSLQWLAMILPHLERMLFSVPTRGRSIVSATGL